MKHVGRIARTHVASGRFLFALIVWLGACSVVETGTDTPLPSARPDPVVERGDISRGRMAQAAQLFGQAQEAFEGERFAEARALAERVVSEYAAAPVSGRALILQARAALGEGKFAECDAAAARYAALLASGDPRIAEANLLRAQAQMGTGSAAAALDRLLLIGDEARVNTRLRATEAAREVVSGLDLQAMETRAPGLQQGGAVAAIGLARYARLLLEAGRSQDAATFAQLALDTGAQGADSLLADAVLTGRLQGPRTEATRVRIATVLPVTGSPAMQDFAAGIAEGIEVAAATVLGAEYTVEIDALDDQGDVSVGAALVRDVRGVAGVVGFLEDRSLAAAMQGRSDDVPLVSPTARAAPADGEGVFTLAGADPQAAGTVARYGVQQGITRAAVVHSFAPESVAEADAIEAALTAAGVPVVGRFGYEVGATFFEPQIMGAQNALRAAEIAALNLGEEDTLHVELLEPVALFLPIPPEDVEFVAPQVTHFGLDTLAIQILGTSGWTDPQVLEAVDTRHTDGVVATAAVDAGPGSAGHARFRSAYEEHFQRSLISPIPALGYDATLLLLEGIRAGGTSQRAMRTAMSRIRGLEGATGVFSLVAGQVVRRTQLVRLDHGVVLPIG